MDAGWADRIDDNEVRLKVNRDQIETNQKVGSAEKVFSEEDFKGIIPVLRDAVGTNDENYVNGIIPIMANIAGFDPHEFSGGLDYLLNHQIVSVTLSNGKTASGIPRKVNYDGTPTNSIWAKGTGELIMALMLDGRMQDAARLLKGVEPLIQSNGGVWEALGRDNDAVWPYDFRESSIEGAAIFLLIEQAFKAYLNRLDYKKVINYDAAMKASELVRKVFPGIGNPLGGIDLNAKNIDWDVQGKGVVMRVDPLMLAQFERGDFTGVEDTVLKTMIIPSPLPVLGLEMPVTVAKISK